MGVLEALAHFLGQPIDPLQQLLATTGGISLIERAFTQARGGHQQVVGQPILGRGLQQILRRSKRFGVIIDQGTHLMGKGVGQGAVTARRQRRQQGQLNLQRADQGRKSWRDGGHFYIIIHG